VNEAACRWEPHRLAAVVAADAAVAVVAVVAEVAVDAVEPQALRLA